MIKKESHRTIAAICISGTLAFSNAYAQTPETPAPAEEVQTVKVTGVRDPAMMPYKDAYKLLTSLNAASRDRVEVVIRVVSAKTKQPIRDLDLALSGPNTYEKVEVNEEGRVKVPLIERAVSDNADFVTNQKKNSIGVEIHLRPKLPAENFKYADIIDSIEGGKRALKELVPWYYRIFIPSVKSVAICYPHKNAVVAVSNAPNGNRPALNEHMDGKEKVYCADFEANERTTPKDSVITPAPGYRALYRQ